MQLVLFGSDVPDPVDLKTVNTSSVGKFQIKFQDIKFSEKIGEGSSGEVYK